MATKTVPGTPSWLRARNDRTALALLLEHGALTRTRLGELSGLSKPTAAQMVSRLEEAGLIHVVGEISAGRGPNAVSYAVRSERLLGVAIDIAGTTMRASAVDVSGTEHPVLELTLSRSARERSPVSDVRAAIDAVRGALGRGDALVHEVGIGVQGAVDQRTGELSFTEALPGWPRTGAAALIEAELGLRATIDNDVNLAAIAERAEGSAAQSPSFALLWMGEGLGLGVDVEGTVHRGAAGGAGEIGYLPVPRDAAELEPSARELQDLIGGAALSRLARSEGVRGRGYPQIVAALQGSERRDAVIEALAPRIASGIVPVLALLDPNRIVLGGPTGRLGGARLAALVRERLRRTSRWNPDVVASTVQGDAVLRGARHVLMATLRERLFDEVDSLT